MLVRNGRVVVTDEGKSLRYYTESGDNTYIEVPTGQVRQLCAQHGVVLNDADPDRYPEIQRELAESESVRRAVDLVSGALDALSDASLRPDLRDPRSEGSPARRQVPRPSLGTERRMSTRQSASGMSLRRLALERRLGV